MKILVINAGSSSLKYQLINNETEEVLAKGTVERIGIKGGKLTHKAGGKEFVIEKEIKEMPNYFSDYDTTVHFISEEELKKNHSGIPHGGFVLRSGRSATDNKFLMEFSLKLDSNPEFTSSVLVAYARAVYRLAKEGKTGAVTAFDIAPKYLSPLSEEEQRKLLL